MSLMYVFSVIFDVASLLLSLVSVFLLIRNRSFLRSKLISKWVVLGAIFFSFILSIHFILEVLEMETEWLSSFMHFIWVAGLTAGIVIIVHYGRLLHGYFSLSVRSFQSLSNRLAKIYCPSVAQTLLYAVGKEAGYDEAIRLMKKTKLRDEAFVRWLIGICENMGWGRYEILSMRVGEEITLRVYGCFETEGLTKKDLLPLPLLCFQSGFFAGVAKALRPSMECEARETKCPFQGDPYCEFTVTFSKP